MRRKHRRADGTESRSAGIQSDPPACTRSLPPVEQTEKKEAHTVLALEGMTCASCSMRIEKGLKKVPGVIDAQVNLATERGTVTYDPEQTGIAQMVQKVEATGYKATPIRAMRTRCTPPKQSAAIQQGLHLLSTADLNKKTNSRESRVSLFANATSSFWGSSSLFPSCMLSMFFMDRFRVENILLLMLTTPVWAIVGWEFHRGALKTLRHGSANMDTLVSLRLDRIVSVERRRNLFPSLLVASPFMIRPH